MTKYGNNKKRYQVGDYCVKKVTAPPKGRPLEPAEIDKMLSHTKSPHLQNFIYLMIATAARPDAILDLTFAQCDIEKCLIQLNPTGRVQTKKHRPTVKMPEYIVPLIERLRQSSKSPHLITYHGKPLASVKKAWRDTRVLAELDMAVNPYSLRHTMARWLRTLRTQSVPAWEGAAQLGHKQSGMSTTEIYASYDPAYLSQSVAAIDTFFDQLRVKCV